MNLLLIFLVVLAVVLSFSVGTAIVLLRRGVVRRAAPSGACSGRVLGPRIEVPGVGAVACGISRVGWVKAGHVGSSPIEHFEVLWTVTWGNGSIEVETTEGPLQVDLSGLEPFTSWIGAQVQTQHHPSESLPPAFRRGVLPSGDIRVDTVALQPGHHISWTEDRLWMRRR